MISSTRVILREKRLANAWDDYAWGIDPELAALDAAPVLTDTFADFLRDYADEINSPYLASRRFAIHTLEGKHIGNCSYYNISEKRGEAELGIMIGNRDYWNKGYGTDIITTLVNYIFSETRLSRVYLKTLASNHRAQKCFQKCGFMPCGYMAQDGYSFLLMEIRRKKWPVQ
ncbi:MAG: GNAT family N-acetyltransferase [Chloroflexi bacterium]|nr:GNAT family N-acetyltransferase [Chloroflexota bacterium]